MPHQVKRAPFAFFRTLLKETDSSKTLHIAITLVLAFALFSFIHIREVRVPMLDLGAIASKYIVAEVPFAFVDEEATTVARQEALLDVGKVYIIDSDDILQRGVEFENSLIYDQSWRNRAPQTTFDEMCRANERLKRILLEIRFTDTRTLEKMRQLSMDTKCIHEIAPVDLTQGAYFPEKIWQFIKNRAFYEQTFQPITIEFLLSFFREKIWTLKEDIQTIRKIRKKIQETVPDKFTSVAPGSRVIDSGERVTTRHIAMLQAMKQAMAEKRNLWHPRTVAGSFILAALFVGITYIFLKNYHPFVLTSNNSYLLLTSIVILGLMSAKLCEVILLRANSDIIDLFRFPLLTPFVAILLCTLLNSSIALFFVIVLSVLYDVTLAFDFQGFLLTNVLVGLVVIFCTKTLRRRLEIVGVSFKGWLAACLIILALYLYDKSRWGVALLADFGSAGSFMMVTAVFVVGILPLFESCFQILTDINLMEYMDPNHYLLRRLMMEAPGTYQHSLIMGGISESAAQTIGCNGLFCRVATLYHDIGKVSIAQYFTENQQSGMNIHQLLTPTESAKVIISHVTEGIILAKQEGLPEPFIDIIREHHGTNLVYYFYHKQLESLGHDYSQINETDFRYFGPKPRTKESGIIMIADSFEAASRSLDEITEESFSRLIDQIVKEKMDDGQLDNCNLTFEELTIVKKAMVKSLLSIGHFRVKYPSRQRVKPA